MKQTLDEPRPDGGATASAVGPELLDLPGRLARARERLVVPMPDDGWFGWLGPLAVTLLAGLIRFVHLGTPSKIAFDETYYVKGALSLAQFGYERKAVDGADALVNAGRSDVFTSQPDYVVHPPFGKWLISLGTDVFGVTPFGWRFTVAVCGTLLVLVVARTGRRLFRSTLIGCAAGLLLAVDGVAVVMSRIALLDGILTLLVVGAFGCLVVDRDRARRRLADSLGSVPLDDLGRFTSPGPWLGARPWRIAAGVLLGLALGTKWSALWFIAGFGLLTVLWDLGARRTAGIPRPVAAVLRRDAAAAFASLVVVAVGVYLLTWSGWFLADDSYGRHWADGRSSMIPLVPAALRSLWHYHYDVWTFHTGLTTPHPYQSNPWGWLIQARPTAMFYENVKGCGAAKCTSAVSAIGNPALWWPGVVALAYLVLEWAGRRDWRAGAILCGVVAGWVPWLVLYNGRTVFAFYAVVIAPFMALAVAYALGRILGPDDASPRRRAIGAAVVGCFLAIAVLSAAFFLPVWNGSSISYAEWGRRMWLRSWI